MLNTLITPHTYPGKLFVVEGIDGSGKSTQLMLLHQWLRAEGYGVVLSEWNSSPLVKNTTRRGKRKLILKDPELSAMAEVLLGERVGRGTGREEGEER